MHFCHPGTNHSAEPIPLPGGWESKWEWEWPWKSRFPAGRVPDDNLYADPTGTLRSGPSGLRG